MKIISLLLLVLFSFCMLTCKKDSPTAPPNGVDTTSHYFSWHADTIGIYPSYLHGVWGTDANNVYAVGFVELSYSPYTYTGIMHWNGLEWASANYLEGFLQGIYGFSGNDIWVVGYWQVDNNGFSLIGHWDGTSWSSWKLNQYGPLFSIWGTSSSNLYAVGLGGLILHYDGTSWTQEQSGTVMDLSDVWGINSSLIFAAGSQNSTGQGVLLGYDGASWKTVTKGGVNVDSATLYGTFQTVWCSTSTKLFLAGALCYEGTPGHWNLSDIPNNSPGPNLTGLAAMEAVRGNASNNVFICGDRDLIIHWNGNSWNIYNQFFDKSKQSSLTGVWMKDKSVFIVGYENSESQAIVYRGTQ